MFVLCERFSFKDNMLRDTNGVACILDTDDYAFDVIEWYGDLSKYIPKYTIESVKASGDDNDDVTYFLDRRYLLKARYKDLDRVVIYYDGVSNLYVWMNNIIYKLYSDNSFSQLYLAENNNELYIVAKKRGYNGRKVYISLSDFNDKENWFFKGNVTKQEFKRFAIMEGV